jgi:hypothetical protein
MISCSVVEITSATSKPGKEKGIECNEKLLMKTCVLSAFLYEPERQWLSTPSAGEPGFRVLDRTKEAEDKRQESKRVGKTALFRRTRGPISEMNPNFHPNVFWVKIRSRGSQASICVRIFTQFTKE